MKPEPVFYVERAEGNVAGPYDLVQMAGLLRKKIITPETRTRLEGEDEWKPFGEQALYIVVLEIPADAISMRVAALDEEAREPTSPIPLPSGETLRLVGSAAAVIAVVSGLCFMIGKTDPAVAPILIWIAGGIALAGQCLIIARLLDEDVTTLALMFFIPLYDIFYFATNIREYFPYLCLKYGGMAAAAATAAGMALSGVH